MIHDALRYGNFASWDPRTDLTMLHLDAIAEFEKEYDMPDFLNFIYSHEGAHRRFYQYPALLDIASINFMMTRIVWDYSKNMDDSMIDRLWMVKDYLKRTHNMIQELGPILDADFALFLYTQYDKLQRNYGERYVDILINSNLLDKESEDAFNSLLKIYNFSKKRLAVPVYIILWSLMYGCMPFALRPNEKPNVSVDTIFYGLLDVMETLIEKSPSKATEIVNDILNFPYNDDSIRHVKMETLALEKIKKHFPLLNLTVDHDDQDWRRQRHDEFAKTFFKKKLLKTDPVELANETPLILITEKDGNYKIYPKKRISLSQKGLALQNVVITHSHDCIWHNYEISCFFCEIGFCQRCTKSKVQRKFVEKNHQYVNIIENKVKKLYL